MRHRRRGNRLQALSRRRRAIYVQGARLRADLTITVGHDMTETANAEMREYWNGAVGERWAAFQPGLDKALQAISDATLVFAAAKAGERVLDIGCGTGTTTYALAKPVGASGSVTGVDISRPMLAVARARGTGVNFREGDASNQLFHPTHDLVFSRFGVMF